MTSKRDKAGTRDAGTRADGPRQIKPSRLGVRHLLVWMGCCGLYLAAMLRLADQRPGGAGLLILVVTSVVQSTSLAGLLVFLHRHFRRGTWTMQPGEALLAVWGATVLVDLLLRSVLRAGFVRIELVLQATTSCLLILPALSRKLPARWIVFFCAATSVYALPVLCIASEIWLEELGRRLVYIRWAFAGRESIYMVLMILVMAVWDARSKATWGWLHYLGLFCCVNILALDIFVRSLPA